MIPEFDKEEPYYLEHIARYAFAAQFVKNKTVLDIACGSGYGSKYLADHGAARVIGVDSSDEAIRYSNKTYSTARTRYLVGDAHAIPLDDHSVDIVVSFETIEHFGGQDVFLKEVRRVLKDAGMLIISTPNVPVYPSGNQFHKKEFTLQGFKAFLAQYFPHLCFFYQNNIISDGISSEDQLQEKTDACIKNIDVYRSVSQNPEQHRYILGVCSKQPIGQTVRSSIVIGDGTKLNRLDAQVFELQQERARAQQKMGKLEAEIQTIYNSRSWKIATFLHKVKTKIPFQKKK
ncbi:MAG: class I SAM-dependent methyltransferase [Patescibacteria group bacterium]|nr:class I SAM-dependent methyltransferase [Patescibacteria group bacterium]MDD5715425.1 class I SAM-dependent methyltransferase [Patescibacteria group bacterium]